MQPGAPSPDQEPDSGTSTPGSQWFATTHWSVVLAAGSDRKSTADEALNKLCRNYWYPLYAYVRRAGYSESDAQDLTQEFFARLLEREDFAQARPDLGRFRSYLLGGLKHFLADEWDRARAEKRGGGKALLSLDAADAETRYRIEPRHDFTPDKVFERRWAITLLEQTLNELQDEFARAGKQSSFDHLKQFVTGDHGLEPYSVVAERLGISEAAVKMHVQRLRKRYRELLRMQVAQTVSQPAEIEQELRHLAAALRG